MSELFDTLACVSGPCGVVAKARNEIGAYAEEMAARALKLTRTPITNAEICPDFSLGDLRGEIKSVGCSGQAIAYKWRIEKEARLFDPVRYLYLYVRHGARIDVKDRSEIITALAGSGPFIVACTLADVIEAIGNKPHKLFSLTSNKDHGSNRAGYCEGGWQFRLTKVATDGEQTASFPWPWIFETLTVRIKTTPRFRYACKTP